MTKDYISPPLKGINNFAQDILEGCGINAYMTNQIHAGMYDERAFSFNNSEAGRMEHCFSEVQEYPHLL